MRILSILWLLAREKASDFETVFLRQDHSSPFKLLVYLDQAVELIRDCRPQFLQQFNFVGLLKLLEVLDSLFQLFLVVALAYVIVLVSKVVLVDTNVLLLVHT